MYATGETYIYRGDASLGAAARVADPHVDETLPTPDEKLLGVAGYAPGGADHPEGPRAALDMHPGMPVTVAGHDDDRDLVLVNWVDGQDNPRTTSIDPRVFADQFDPQV